MPVWIPIGLIWEYSETKGVHEAKDKEKAALPLQVAACWTEIDRLIKDKLIPFVGFKWDSGKESSYVLLASNKIFSDDKPVPIDSEVTLRHGRVQFNIDGMRLLWTDADVECGLRTDDVVATRVMLRK
jgi:hypothetical protein